MTYHRILIFALLLIVGSTQSSFAQAVLGKTEKGKASYYASRFHGKKTAFGEVHSGTEFSAAHRSYPLNTMLEVTNLDNNEKVVVRVNDRGPYSHHRIIDVSKEAAKILGLMAMGVANVSVRVVGMEGMVLLGEDEEMDARSGKIVSMHSKK
ncbi:Endolytic peptidoglycan transglycosylase RlpA [Dyadobacter sp. CECT 9275]|uniref:Probable endolytic peptidoglycan transglycosylase RlpA n=1 Tax=Dyadobacter helix TaxID=2822344 RepID=A0A916JGC8_9BACT|nr:septal ring lytic transglycosylase RlpA family protein [Dyadobacter sp. CECT 9275]CAG5005157.1 Endolytic peptidoglycan transglycosylase RlpA [Dyadobacter sp. CECT 9275]